MRVSSVHTRNTFTCKTCVNMCSAIQTVRYGPILRCSSLYIFNGASPELYLIIMHKVCADVWDSLHGLAGTGETTARRRGREGGSVSAVSSTAAPYRHKDWRQTLQIPSCPESKIVSNYCLVPGKHPWAIVIHGPNIAGQRRYIRQAYSTEVHFKARIWLVSMWLILRLTCIMG